MAFKYKLSFFFSLQLIQTSVLLTTGHSLSMEVFFNLSWILGVGGGEWGGIHCVLIECSCFKNLLLFFSHWVMSSSFRPHEPHHTMFSCPSPGVCSNSCPLYPWCYLPVSSSVTPFSSCPQSVPASGCFLMSWLFIPGGQSIGASAIPSVIKATCELFLTGPTTYITKV